MMADQKHILTGSNLMGYNCSVCKEAWGNTFLLEEIIDMPCKGHESGRIVFHMRVDMKGMRLELPQHPQCPPYLETPQERKGAALLKEWAKPKDDA